MVDLSNKFDAECAAFRGLGLSYGEPVYGNGGTDLWWERYDMAVSYFEKHGALNGFRLSGWTSLVREQKRKNILTWDQVEFLKKIKFDYSPQSEYQPIKEGTPLQRAKELIQIYDDCGVSEMDSEERAALVSSLKTFSGRYKQGKLSERSAKELGVNDDRYNVVISSVRAFELSEKECDNDGVGASLRCG